MSDILYLIHELTKKKKSPNLLVFFFFKLNLVLNKYYW